MSAAACRSALRELLPWYLNGSLEGGEAGAVRDHIAACSGCAAELDALGDLANLVRVHGVPIDHRGRGATWPAVVPLAAPRHSPRLRRNLAAGIAALLAGIALLGFFRLRSRPDAGLGGGGAPVSASIPADASSDGGAPAPAGPPAAIVARLELGAGPLRGEAGLPVLRLPEEAAQVEVFFIVPGGGTGATAGVEDEAGRPVADPIPVPGHDEIGRVSVVFPVAAFRDSGGYALVLSQREQVDSGGSGAGGRAEYRYPFRVVAPHRQSPAATNAPQ